MFQGVGITSHQENQKLHQPEENNSATIYSSPGNQLMVLTTLETYTLSVNN